MIAEPQVLANVKGQDIVWIRGLVVSAAPVAILLLSSLLSADAKAVLIFWRTSFVLPGHRAFTEHAPGDARIDLGNLKKNVGALPDDPKEQNALWFKLYKKVENDVAVLQAHKAYLLFRDLASMSALLAPTLLAIVWIVEGSPERGFLAFVLFGVQYIACMIAARNSANRMVTNVLSAHAAKRRTA
jgi:hypothetical protein